MLQDSLHLFIFFFTKFYFALLKEKPHSAMQNNVINNSHICVYSLFWYYCYQTLPVGGNQLLCPCCIFGQV